MAKTIKITKLIQIPGPVGHLHPSVRRRAPKPAGLYLLELRANSQPPFSRRRLQITINAPGNPDAQPEPIKITLA